MTAATPAAPGAGSLPIDAVLDEIVASIEQAGRLVLEAPPGAGKTTRVPLALLATDPPGRIVVLEPRRVAARAAAARLADQLGEPVGRTVGVTTRDDRRTSAATRIEVVTDGIVLRRIQRDPALVGTSLLFFDEFHERRLDADLTLAFALESRAALREDLRILVASATLEGPRLARLLDDAPVVRAQGRSFPCTIEHRDRVDVRALPEAAADAVVEVLDDPALAGDLLVFLPGVREIERARRALTARTGDRVDVRTLHGRLPPDAQDQALRPAPEGRRKVVLATDVAESSLTIAGIRVVVDAGRSREPRFDATTGLGGLVTVAASKASATQRAGRAGRTGPGHVIRLWAQREHAGRDEQPRPAIATDDLTGAALEVAAWGAAVDELPLLDRPPPAAWDRAQQTLRMLAALDGDGRVTAHGRELVALPVHPRLGHLLLQGRARGLGGLATELAAVLGDRDPVADTREAPCADLAVRVRVLRGGSPPAGVRLRRAALARARDEQRRLARLLDLPDQAGRRGRGRAARHEVEADLDALGGLVLDGWPERLAQRRRGQRGRFLLAAGRGAVVAAGDLLAGEGHLAVARLDRGEGEARIHLAAAVDEATIRARLGGRLETRDVIGWVDGEVVAERREQLGAIVLRQRPIEVDADAAVAALLEGLRTEGLGLLDWRPEDRTLQARLTLLHETDPHTWPDVRDAALLADTDRFLAPFLLGRRRARELGEVRATDVLMATVPPRRRGDLDRLAPTHLTVPSGSRIRLDYLHGDRPVLAVKLQELFGARTTPAIVDGRVPVVVHVLSPAQRPVQVTDDLAGFWERTYPEVRAELRGRYPKHAWPEDPTTAVPHRGTRRRPSRG